MDKRLYIINLYDYYGELLTEKQRKYFESYYFDNLSLAEISENENVSRNAIYKQLKEAENKLCHYEKILKDYEKSIKIKEIIKKFDKETQKSIEDLL